MMRDRFVYRGHTAPTASIVLWLSVIYIVSTIVLVLLWSSTCFGCAANDTWEQQHPKLELRPYNPAASIKEQVKGRCAINLYGLPRQFKNIVLPGLLENVVKPNAAYECDYFIHFYDRKEETLERGVDRGRSGLIDPAEVYLLNDAVLTAVPSYNPKVKYASDTEEQFWKQYGLFVDRLLTATGPDGRSWYRPLNDDSYTNGTIANIIKMWHSQQSVWNLMMDSSSTTTHYSRVAMLRLDVLYVTPIDVYQLPDHSIDKDNKFAVIPGFAGHPVNDRLMYGPYDALRIWAAGRFSRLKQHAELVHTKGYGIHSERFLYHTIFPAIRDSGIDILKENGLCFLRVRADASVRFSDCSDGSANGHNQKAVESLLQQTCSIYRTEEPSTVKILECGDTHEKPTISKGVIWQLHIVS